MQAAKIFHFSLQSPGCENEEDEHEQRVDGAMVSGGKLLLDLGAKEPQIREDTTDDVQMNWNRMDYASSTYDERGRVATTERKNLSNDSAENSCCEDAVARLKHEMLELLKNEFTCCICEEIVMKATVTKCSHMFCAFCLQESKKMRTTCPICRAQRILERPARSVDEYVTKMVKLISEDLPARRSAMIRERDEIKLKKATRRSRRLPLMMVE